MRQRNLDYLRTAVFIKKDMKNSESDNVVDGHIRTDSKEFNQLFLDPYKSFIINTAGRLKSDDPEVIPNFAKFGYGDDLLTTVKRSLLESIYNFIEMNVRDTLLSIGSSFIDDLASQFVYGQSKYGDHYEFEFPYKLVTRHDDNIIEKLMIDIDLLFDRSICNLLDYIWNNSETDTLHNDYTYQAVIGMMFDTIYSKLVKDYFDKLIIDITSYYIGKPNILEDFYISFLDENFVPFKENGYNNMYNYISIALREMMEPHLEKFKDCLFVISNTVSSMIAGFDINSYRLRYEEYIRLNPFAYEILDEKYNTKKEEDDEDELSEYNEDGTINEDY